jgi:hypothetical protein
MEGQQGRRRLVSHSEVARFLGKFGYSAQLIGDVLQDLPDPIDPERVTEVFSQHGITIGGLMDQMGASP